MFGFGKKKEKKQNHLDKILMGMVVGGAIGSVLGVGLAPKKGSETRKELSTQANKAVKTARKSIFDLARKVMKPKSRLSSGHTVTPVKPGHLPVHGGKSIPEDK
jgi:gas vesicle protein